MSIHSSSCPHAHCAITFCDMMCERSSVAGTMLGEARNAAFSAAEIWVTHGREEALVHYARQKGYRAGALALAGFDEDE